MAALIKDPASIRQRIHAWPELGFLEFGTAGFVVEQLQESGFEVLTGEQAMDRDARMGLPPAEILESELEIALGRGLDPKSAEAFAGGMTAVVGRLRGRGEGPHRGFRFDLDALPVTESSAVGHRPGSAGYASERPGLMHACGHDGHVAIGLALAAKLAANPPSGDVTIVFQPAEEGLRGGAAVAASGALDQIDELYCLHLGLGLPTGLVRGSTDGLLYSDKLRARFKGRAAHAGMSPETGRNALLAAASATVTLHTLPQYSGPGAKLNVGILEGGTATNVVPEEAVMAFETRAPDTEAGIELTARAEECVRSAAGTFGVEVEIERTGGAPAVVCDKTAAESVERAAAKIEGLDCPPGPHVDSGSEDASWLLERVREKGGIGTYIAFGSDSPAGHHESDFDIDEQVLPLAVELCEAIAHGTARHPG